MSRKNSLEEKKIRRARKSLRNTPTSYINLIEYVKDRTGCTTGMAKKVLLSGCIMVDSHPVGVAWVKDPLGAGGMKRVIEPLLDAKHRPNIRIRSLEEAMGTNKEETA